jgi:regulator of PEP synthase PpsR (kinase-PPPase family)
MGMSVSKIHQRSYILRASGIEVRKYSNQYDDLPKKRSLSLEQLVFIKDSTGSTTEILRDFMVKYPETPQTAYTILGLITHRARLLEQISNKTPKPKIQNPVVFDPCVQSTRALEKTECELLTEILNELRILNSYAAQPKKQS